MKIWDVEIWAVVSKKTPDFWEHWSTETVATEGIEDAIAKAVESYKTFKFFKVEARKAELVREVDIE